MKWQAIFDVHTLAKAIVLFFIGFAFFLLIWPYWMEDERVFEITEPSRAHIFFDSSYSRHADVVEAAITGHLDGTASVNICYSDMSHQVWTFELPEGRIDSSGRWDFYGRGIQVDFIPGAAKKGHLKIITKVF